MQQQSFLRVITGGRAPVRPAGQYDPYGVGGGLQAAGYNPDTGQFTSGTDQTSGTTGGTTGGATGGGGTQQGGGNIYSFLGQALGVAGSTIQNVIQSNNQADIARLNIQAQTATNNLLAQMNQQRQMGQQPSATDQATLSALQTFIAQTRAQAAAVPTSTYLLIGGGILAVGAIAFFASRGRRRNPAHVLLGHSPYVNPVVIRHGRKVFISARHLHGKHRRRSRR